MTKIVPPLFIVFALTGCVTGNGAGADCEANNDTGKIPVCEPVVVVSSASELLAQIEPGWPEPCGEATFWEASPTLTGGLMFSVTIDDFGPLPDICDVDDPCVVTLSVDTNTVSVELKKEQHDMWDVATEATFGPGTFRIRKEMWYTGPSSKPMFLVRILPPCTTTCRSFESLCDDGTCWLDREFYRYCVHCQMRPPEECACQTAEGAVPDGQDCFTQPTCPQELSLSGQCFDGVCRKYAD